jgi:membrane-associated protease RseP (regulator of RpoE activity)
MARQGFLLVSLCLGLAVVCAQASQKATDNDQDNEQQKKNDGRTQRRGYLGIDAVPVNRLSPADRKRLKLKEDKGLVVIQVMPDSPAARAGIRRGDLLAGIDGKKVTTSRELQKAIRQAGAGKKVTLVGKRGKEDKKFQAKLAASPCEGPGQGLRPPFPVNWDLQREVEKLRRQLRQLEKRVRELEKKKGNSEGE